MGCNRKNCREKTGRGVCGGGDSKAKSIGKGIQSSLKIKELLFPEQSKPTKVHSNGVDVESWKIHDKLHRKNGPAYTVTDSTTGVTIIQEFWENGERRKEGPHTLVFNREGTPYSKKWEREPDDSKNPLIEVYRDDGSVASRLFNYKDPYSSLKYTVVEYDRQGNARESSLYHDYDEAEFAIEK
jgi:hypothetical protein